METTQFLVFADCLPEPMLLVSQQGQILAGNIAAHQLLKPADNELSGKQLVDYVQETSLELDNYLRACAKNTQPLIGSLTCYIVAEKTLCYGRSLQPGSIESAILLRCMSMAIDGDNIQPLNLQADTLQQEVTRRQQIEAQFAFSEAHAQAVLNTAVEGIITIDEHGIVQSFNLAAERIFGYSAEEIIGRNVHWLMPNPYHDEHDSYLCNYLSTGQKKIIGIGREVQGLRKDGSVFPLELAVSEVNIAGQHHFTGIVRDISERKQIEEHLRHNEEEIRLHRERLAHVDRISIMGEMASGIAHEINQPLTAISSYARACYRMLDADLADPAELLETLDKISVQAQRAGNVIHGLRAFVRKRESKRELHDLNDLVRNTIVLAETDARENHFVIKPILIETPLPVVVDPIQIQQVILNLIRNAAEAMADVTEEAEAVMMVVKTAIDDPQTAQVAVVDKGNGISDEIADKLFDPFFTTKPAGTGIGLAISRTIITSHGGRLWFEPNSDKGITMHFSLALEHHNHDE